MGKKKKTTSKFVMLGDRAYSFYDPTTGISLVKGQKKELTFRQLSTVRIKRALHTGHLQYVAEDNVKVAMYTDDEIEGFVDRFKSMVAEGMEASKISKAFSDDQVDLIAKDFNLERDDKENSVEVIEAIIKEIESSNDTKGE